MDRPQHKTKYVWAARDSTGLLNFYFRKPTKGFFDWNTQSGYFGIPKSWFPNIKWEDKKPTKITVNF